MNKIYGINPDGKITTLMIRDAICKCFYEAHCKDAQLSNEESMSQSYCTQIVKKSFQDSGGDFNSPTKQSILDALDNLADFSDKFRNKEIIDQHKKEILELVNKLD